MERWLGSYLLELLRGPWPEMVWVRHAFGWHQIGYELEKRGLAKSPLEGLGVDIPNHLIPLSPFGWWQVEQTQKHIERALGFEPDGVYHSQMCRARQTAQGIFPGARYREDPRLNEKDYAGAHMLADEDVRAQFPAHDGRYRRDGKYFVARCPGGENYIDMFVRLHSILDTLRRDYPGGRVVIVTHSAVMLTVRQLFEHYCVEDLIRVGHDEWIPNCGILHYRPKNNGRHWGWERGRFRVELAQKPYKLWADPDGIIEAQYWEKSLEQLPDLRQQFAA